ncbi:MAG: thioredoxin domain-containing protein [Pyrinomonadaceae bacterium]
MSEHQFTNRLAQESSPYLLQHANNPVNWFPWGDEAFAVARAEDKPILLSVGYSACHWCHVMAHESFEDEEIARLMNELFVNIKVDREERPDLDQIYMNAVQMMTHHGGWPMTVFLTPEGIPFYGGTYYPPVDGYNMPGFPRVLISVAEAYRDRRAEIAETSTSLLNELRRLNTPASSPDLSPELLDAAAAGIIKGYDNINGGFGGAPKFPPAMSLEFLLRTHVRKNNRHLLDIIRNTCKKMANGGIYDHLGDGFHRYSTDAKWLVPHFEKMLYDNALLSRLYLHYYQVSRDESARSVVEGILDYVTREMTDTDGGFYSTQDADSEGHEGKFFVWSVEEIKSILDEPSAELFSKYYNISESGNFEGKNILHVTESLQEVAREFDLSLRQAEELIAKARKALFEVREQRIKPGRDEKILTAWNGLMLASFCEAGVVLNRPDYTETARRNAEFILSQMRSGKLLFRSYNAGVAKHNAYLEDYAFLTEGLLTLFETTGEVRWLEESFSLTQTMVEEFWDKENGGFYFTGASHEQLITRSKDYFDNAIPSGNSVAAHVMLRLATLLDNSDFRNRAATILIQTADSARRYASGFGYLLSVLDFYLFPTKELALVGRTHPALRPFVVAAWSPYLPNKVVAPTVEPELDRAAAISPLLREKRSEAQVTAYICENYTCREPLTDLEKFSANLAAESQLRPSS